MSQTVGEIFAILAAVCAATSSLLYNKLGKKASSDILAGLRMFIATPVMCCYALIKNGYVLPTIDLYTLFIILLSGFIGFFITDLFMFRAYVSWGARETMVVLCLTPVFSGVFAYLIFDEVLTIRQIVGSLCSLSGVVIMTLGDKSKGTAVISKGAIFALCAAFFQSLSDMTAKFALTELPPMPIAAIRACSGAFAWLVLSFFSRKKFAEAKPTVMQPKFFATLVVTVMIGTVFGTSLAMGAIKFAPVGIVSSLKQMAPVFILLFEFIFLKKKLGVSDVLGTFISVFGVFLLF